MNFCIELVPDIIMVDGNGVLHPRRCGLASHLGVVLDVPTIGVGKKLLQVDGLTKADVKAGAASLEAGKHLELKGESGQVES